MLSQGAKNSTAVWWYLKSQVYKAISTFISALHASAISSGLRIIFGVRDTMAPSTLRLLINLEPCLPAQPPWECSSSEARDKINCPILHSETSVACFGDLNRIVQTARLRFKGWDAQLSAGVPPSVAVSQATRTGARQRASAAHPSAVLTPLPLIWCFWTWRSHLLTEAAVFMCTPACLHLSMSVFPPALPPFPPPLNPRPTPYKYGRIYCNHSVRLSDRVRTITPEPLNRFKQDLVWWCVIKGRNVMQKNCSLTSVSRSQRGLI